MRPVRKAFDKSLYQKYDALAREATREHLESKGYEVQEHPNKYAQDLIAEKDLEINCVECEVKLVWKGEEFPYDSVQLPERKKKFFKEPTLFYIWNKQLTHAATFWSHDVACLEPVEVRNKYISRGELFYQIPLELVTFIKK